MANREAQNEKKENLKFGQSKISSSSEESEKIFPEFSREKWKEERDYLIGIETWPKESTPSKRSSENSLTLNFLESGTVISLFEDFLSEIMILKYVIDAPVLSSWSYEYKTLDERFSEKALAERIFPEVDSIPALTTSLKLQRDRQLLEIVTKLTMKTMLDDGSFDPLITASRRIMQQQADEEKLVEKFKENMAYLNDVKARVKEKRRLEDVEEKQRDELLYKLQDEIDDVKLKCGIEERFVDKWETTRNKQNKRRLKNAEDFYNNDLANFKIKSELENRVTNEMQTFIKSDQLYLEKELETWMTRYDSEMERRENKIIQLKYEREQQEDETKRLIQLYDDRIEEMKEWIDFREIRKQRISASLIIQAWWRGLMVRKKMGPYKPKKPKSKEVKKK